MAHSVSRFLYAVFAQLAVLPAHNRGVAGSTPASGTTPAARPANTPYCQAWQPEQGQKGLSHGTQTSNDDKAKAILDALHEETDALRDELDTEKNARVAAEKERDAANSGKQTAEKALTDYKTQQTAKESRAAKESKFREQLKAAGVLEKYFDRIVRLSGEDIDKMELDSKGNVKNADKLAESLKTDWSDFVAKTTTTGAKVDNPPANTGAKMTKDQIFAIKDAGERQAAIAATADLFTGGGKE